MDNEINLFIEITGKRIDDKYVFPAEDFKFGAYLRAENTCRQLGLTIGNMYMDYPIGLTKTDKVTSRWNKLQTDENSVGKIITGDSWKNTDTNCLGYMLTSEWWSVNGLITSNDFRYGHVYITTFKL